MPRIKAKIVISFLRLNGNDPFSEFFFLNATHIPSPANNIRVEKYVKFCASDGVACSATESTSGSSDV
ncbi:Uncharacterised protein [uncultured archaeon]|nr:Uncharacterised protein [uncultured archaeon]